MSAYVQLSRVYLASTLDVTHVIKCTRLSPSLAGRAWERGYLESIMQFDVIEEDLLFVLRFLSWGRLLSSWSGTWAPLGT